GSATRPIPMADAAAETPKRDRPVLSVRGLKTYFHQDEGLTRAVDGVSFDIHTGKTLGIVGESGCGKSVTARSILRIVERPGRIVGGEILYRGLGARGWGLGDEGRGRGRGSSRPQLPTP